MYEYEVHDGRGVVLEKGTNPTELTPGTAARLMRGYRERNPECGPYTVVQRAVTTWEEVGPPVPVELGLDHDHRIVVEHKPWDNDLQALLQRRSAGNGEWFTVGDISGGDGTFHIFPVQP